uniref:4-alpha-glucanotransferase n=1 Tax=Ndongobacter massiliensis TaxID=1871025 RepID=UPI000ACD43C1|nr:4-alpha-glucanotransferase [Ndongobacter massiliensis]
MNDWNYNSQPEEMYAAGAPFGHDALEAHVCWHEAPQARPPHTVLPAELELVKYPRGLGVILPIFSLPSPYGIGTFGEAAYRFCDFLAKSGVRYWQVLPLGPTSYGDSPYQSFSGLAGNPYFIDLDFLCAEGLLESEELAAIHFGDEIDRVDYSLLYNQRYRLLWRAFERAVGQTERAPLTPSEAFQQAGLSGDCGTREALAQFREQNADWIEDYALFQALKAEHFDVEWTQWADVYRDHHAEALDAFRASHEVEILFQIFMQYHFFRQWEALRAYAHDKGLLFIGDIPIYVAHDSADVWAARDQFLLDEKGNPRVVAGAPPDVFTADGQRWGNPIYNWAVMRDRNYDFWVRRFRANFRLYDILRLDHFIGFEHYWSVPAEEETARNGRWEAGPGFAFFQKMQEALGPLPILVEDLGVLTPEVIALRERTGFPGMKPLQFAFGGGPDSDYLPHNFERRTSVYTGTHDSDPLRTWWENLDPQTRYLVGAYFAISKEEEVRWALLRGAAASVADLCIFQMQDILWTDASSRTNLPGALGGNWQWRLRPDYADPGLAKKLRELIGLYGR